MGGHGGPSGAAVLSKCEELYKRGMATRAKTEQQKKNQIEQRAEEEKRDCTFHPNMDKSDMSYQNIRGKLLTASSGVSGIGTTMGATVGASNGKTHYNTITPRGLNSFE